MIYYFSNHNKTLKKIIMKGGFIMSKYDKVIKSGWEWFRELTLTVGNDYAKMIANNPTILLKIAHYEHHYEWVTLITILRLSYIIVNDSLMDGGVTIFFSPYNDLGAFIKCYEDTKKRLRNKKTSNITIVIFDGGVYQYNLFTGKKCHKQSKKLARDIFKIKALL